MSRAPNPSPGPSPSVPAGASPGVPAVASPEALRFATWLQWTTRIGLTVMVTSVAVYLLGWLPARVAPEQMAQLWSRPLAEYLQASGAPTGWGWLLDLSHGDMAGLAGIAVLAGGAMPALLALIPVFRRLDQTIFVRLCIAEVLVLALAASGLFGGGH